MKSANPFSHSPETLITSPRSKTIERPPSINPSTTPATPCARPPNKLLYQFPSPELFALL